jgi:hypothetical protein
MTHAVEQYDFDQALELADALERSMGPDDSRSNDANRERSDTAPPS